MKVSKLTVKYTLKGLDIKVGDWKYRITEKRTGVSIEKGDVRIKERNDV